MKIGYSREFKKMFKKLSTRHQDKFEERLCLFIKNTHHPLLNNHALTGEWIGYKSINITGDLRAVYEEITNMHFEFIAIGSHSELYS